MPFRRFPLFSVVGFAFELHNDRAFDKPVEERHCQRPIGKVVTPVVEVHIGNQSCGALLISRGDDLAEQVRRLRTLDALDFVKPEFVNYQKIRTGIRRSRGLAP